MAVQGEELPWVLGKCIVRGKLRGLMNRNLFLIHKN